MNAQTDPGFIFQIFFSHASKEQEKIESEQTRFVHYTKCPDKVAFKGGWSMDKTKIISEIKRTAAENGGTPLGVRRFFLETGLKEHEWNKYWARWGDALVESGFSPLEFQETIFDEQALIQHLINLTRKLGRYPVMREIILEKRTNSSFPSTKVFDRLSATQSGRIKKLLEYCSSHEGCEDVRNILELLPQDESEEEAISSQTSPGTKKGFVYMGVLKIGTGKRYKIGATNMVDRRRAEISVTLPEDLEPVHYIETDDMFGIEAYWHRRFAEKRRNQEWFDLSREDIQAFKKRKFM